MANKQTQPGLREPSKNYIDSPKSPLLPQVEYHSPLHGVSDTLGQTEKFLDNYSKIKYDEFQAGLQNMELQQFHEMEDATDPCQLQEINKKYEKAYDSQYKDDYWGKSYYNSRFYQGWKKSHQVNQEKMYLKMQHKFTTVQTDKTLNQLSNTIALANTPQEVESLLQNGSYVVNNLEHLAPEQRYEFMKKFYNSSVEKIYSNDPNKAVAWLDYAGNRYDQYGLDNQEVRTKANNYNIAQEKLKLYWKNAEDKQLDRDKKLLLENQNDEAYALLNDYRYNKDTQLTLQKIVEEADRIYGDDNDNKFKFLKNAFPSEKSRKDGTTEDLGLRVFNYNSLSSDEQKQLQSDVRKAFFTGKITKTMFDAYSDEMGIADSGIDLNDYISLAEEGGLTDENINQLSGMVAKEEITKTQADSIIDMNTRGAISSYQSDILNDKYVDVNNLKLTKEDKNKLLEFMNKNKGKDTDIKKFLKLFETSENKEEIRRSYNNLSVQDQKTVKDMFQQRKKDLQEENYKRLYTNIDVGSLTTQAQIESATKERRITPEQAGKLNKHLEEKLDFDYKSNLSYLTQAILNKEISDKNTLHQELIKYKVNLENTKSLLNLFDKENPEYAALFNNGIKTLEAFVSNTGLLGTKNDIAISNLNDAKNHFAKDFNEDVAVGKKWEEISNKYNAQYFRNLNEIYYLSNKLNLNLDVDTANKNISEDNSEESSGEISETWDKIKGGATKWWDNIQGGATKWWDNIQGVSDEEPEERDINKENIDYSKGA